MNIFIFLDLGGWPIYLYLYLFFDLVGYFNLFFGLVGGLVRNIFIYFLILVGGQIRKILFIYLFISILWVAQLGKKIYVAKINKLLIKSHTFYFILFYF